MNTADRLIRALGLKPHPKEGGYFAETYRSGESVPAKALPKRYAGRRALSTAIYYLLTPETLSPLHRLSSDEVYHFYIGDPVEVLLLGKKARRMLLGPGILTGERPQLLVPRGTWQGLRLKKGGSFALLGTTVAPGFEYADYEHGDRAALVRAYPRQKAMILALTK
jgi:hypothetical protein